jgi:transcriptional regulator with XRE-family HTH domain
MRQQAIAYREELAELMREITATRSYRQLAKDAELSPSTIGNMVLGRVPSREVCLKVAHAANIPSSKMLEAAGYDMPDALEAVTLALRDAKNMSESSKDEVLRIVREYVERDAAELERRKKLSTQ